MNTSEIYDSLRTGKPVYKSAELCEMLGINRTTLSLYVKYGLISGRKLGTKNVFSFDELMDLLRLTSGMDISNTPEGIKTAAAIVRAGKHYKA